MTLLNWPTPKTIPRTKNYDISCIQQQQQQRVAMVTASAHGQSARAERWVYRGLEERLSDHRFYATPTHMN